VQHEIGGLRTGMQHEIDALRAEIQEVEGRLRTEVQVEGNKLRAELHKDNAAQAYVRKMREQMGQLRQSIDDAKAENRRFQTFEAIRDLRKLADLVDRYAFLIQLEHRPEHILVGRLEEGFRPQLFVHAERQGVPAAGDNTGAQQAGFRLDIVGGNTFRPRRLGSIG